MEQTNRQTHWYPVALEDIYGSKFLKHKYATLFNCIVIIKLQNDKLSTIRKDK